MTATTFAAKSFVAAQSPSSLTKQTCRHPTSQQARLQRPKCHRTILLQAQGLPSHRHPIRQARPEFLGRCSSRSSRRILAPLSLDPSKESKIHKSRRTVVAKEATTAVPTAH